MARARTMRRPELIIEVILLERLQVVYFVESWGMDFIIRGRGLS